MRRSDEVRTGISVKDRVAFLNQNAASRPVPDAASRPSPGIPRNNTSNNTSGAATTPARAPTPSNPQAGRSRPPLPPRPDNPNPDKIILNQLEISSEVGKKDLKDALDKKQITVNELLAMVQIKKIVVAKIKKLFVNQNLPLTYDWDVDHKYLLIHCTNVEPKITAVITCSISNVNPTQSDFVNFVDAVGDKVVAKNDIPGTRTLRQRHAVQTIEKFFKDSGTNYLSKLSELTPGLQQYIGDELKENPRPGEASKNLWNDYILESSEQKRGILFWASLVKCNGKECSYVLHRYTPWSNMSCFHPILDIEIKEKDAELANSYTVKTYCIDMKFNSGKCIVNEDYGSITKSLNEEHWNKLETSMLIDSLRMYRGSTKKHTRSAGLIYNPEYHNNANNEEALRKHLKKIVLEDIIRAVKYKKKIDPKNLSVDQAFCALLSPALPRSKSAADLARYVNKSLAHELYLENQRSILNNGTKPAVKSISEKDITITAQELKEFRQYFSEADWEFIKSLADTNEDIKFKPNVMYFNVPIDTQLIRSNLVFSSENDSTLENLSSIFKKKYITSNGLQASWAFFVDIYNSLEEVDDDKWQIMKKAIASSSEAEREKHLELLRTLDHFFELKKSIKNNAGILINNKEALKNIGLKFNLINVETVKSNSLFINNAKMLFHIMSLCELLGVKFHFCCKHGKDRTHAVEMILNSFRYDLNKKEYVIDPEMLLNLLQHSAGSFLAARNMLGPTFTGYCLKKDFFAMVDDAGQSIQKHLQSSRTKQIVKFFEGVVDQEIRLEGKQGLPKP